MIRLPQICLQAYWIRDLSLLPFSESQFDPECVAHELPAVEFSDEETGHTNFCGVKSIPRNIQRDLVCGFYYLPITHLVVTGT